MKCNMCGTEFEGNFCPNYCNYEQHKKTRKQFYRKWWVWLIVVIIGIGVITYFSFDNATVKTNVIYKAGVYKVGTDIPAGEYYLKANANAKIAFFSITRDSTGKITDIYNETSAPLQNNSIVTVFNGQYLTLTDCEAYPLKGAPVLAAENGILPAGMYKVGLHIKAGKYKVIADGKAYVSVLNDSKHMIGGTDSNYDFEGEKYITVKKGQYLRLLNASVKIK